jgi:hypothetical protein
LLLETSHQFEQRHAKSLTNLAEFDQVEPSLARFILRYERLRLVQPVGKVFLPQSRSETKLP